MEIRQLKTFRTVAALQSFNQAAKVLNYAQSTVSEQIKGLENDLNVQLFLRSGKKIILTEAGESLLQYAQRILDIEDELKSDIVDKNDYYGALSIRVPQTISVLYLPNILKKFHEKFPKIRCKFNTCTYFSLEQEFQSGMTNLAFLITDHYRCCGSNLHTEILMNIPLIFISHPDNPLVRKKSINFEDFRNQTIVMGTQYCSYRAMFERELTKYKVEPDTVLEFSNLESIKRCVMEGTGISLVAGILVKEELSNGLLSALPWKGKQFDAKLLMIWRKDKWISPPLQALMDLFREIDTDE